MSRAERLADEATRARVTALLAMLAVGAAALTLVKSWATAPSVAAALGLASVLLVLAQIAARSYLLQHEQRRALGDLREIKRIAYEELLVEERQNENLELLFRAMRDFNVIQVQSLDALRTARPATSYYLRRHAAAIIDVLRGKWNRTESLRPQQLWEEYAQLVALLKPDEEFRSTVLVPSDVNALLENAAFRSYVNDIYDAARTKQIQVRRLYVLEEATWPIERDQLPPLVVDHLRELQQAAQVTPTLSARVTTKALAELRFRDYPDFMVWGNGLLIESNMNGEDGLVIKANFLFAGSEDREIGRRQEEFDRLFDSDQTCTIEELLGPPAPVNRSRRGNRRRRRTTR